MKRKKIRTDDKSLFSEIPDKATILLTTNLRRQMKVNLSNGSLDRDEQTTINKPLVYVFPI